MKIKSNTIVPKPTLQNITITLTPREAYLLAMLVGDRTRKDMHATLQTYGKKSPRSGTPDKAILQETTKDDINFVETFYDEIMAELVTQHSAGTI